MVARSVILPNDALCNIVSRRSRNLREPKFASERSVRKFLHEHKNARGVVGSRERWNDSARSEGELIPCRNTCRACTSVVQIVLVVGDAMLLQRRGRASVFNFRSAGASPSQSPPPYLCLSLSKSARLLSLSPPFQVAGYRRHTASTNVTQSISVISKTRQSTKSL